MLISDGGEELYVYLLMYLKYRNEVCRYQRPLGTRHRVISYWHIEQPGRLLVSRVGGNHSAPVE